MPLIKSKTILEQHFSSDSKIGQAEKFTILLVEDNFLNRRMAKKALETSYVVKEAADASEAEEILGKENIHLVIVDIHLGHGKNDGIWLAERLRDVYKIPFIYLTAFSTGDIPAKAIATQPSAYITKPFKEIDFELSIKIALQKGPNNEESKSKVVLVKDGDFFVKLSTDDIDYFESDGNYLQVLSDGKMYKCRSTIKEMLTQLPAGNFIQTHRAFIVNKRKIEKFSPTVVVVAATEIPVSEKYADELGL